MAAAEQITIVQTGFRTYCHACKVGPWRLCPACSDDAITLRRHRERRQLQLKCQAAEKATFQRRG